MARLGIMAQGARSQIYSRFLCESTPLQGATQHNGVKETRAREDTETRRRSSTPAFDANKPRRQTKVKKIQN